MDSASKNYQLADSRVIPAVAWITIGGLAGILITIIVYAINGYINLNGRVDSSTMGTFGDFIGGFFGTLFSLVTVFLLWLAYQSQKQELKALSDQGKEQTKIQALTALISTEMAQLDIDNQGYLSSKGSPYTVSKYASEITATKKKIKEYKTMLAEILEQHKA